MYSYLNDNKANNIGDGVYYTLYKNIIELNLKPGETLGTKEISEKLNVSKSPVRDALIKLEKEGLVEVFPQKGSIVSKIDLERVNEERFLRVSLEEKVLEIFIHCYSNQDILDLRNIIEKQSDSLKNQDNLKFFYYDDQFHKIFFEKAKKNMCWNIINEMSGHYKRVRLMHLWEQGIREDLIEEHKQMLEYIYKKDFNSLALLIHDHCSKFMRYEYELVKKYPSYFKLNNENDFLKADFIKSNIKYTI